MLRLIAVAGFALTIATSAQGMTPAPLALPDGIVTQIAVDAAWAEQESTACASHERPSAMLAARSADARDGMAVPAPCMSEPRGGTT
jgi:hypothetical protein